MSNVFFRELSPAQQRVNVDHKATVELDRSGALRFLSEDIVTPKGSVKKNKKISVVPLATETVKHVSEMPGLFSELSHMNVILTNACNLSCTYCYEQHNKDFGRFTEESLLDAYNFLLKYSKQESRAFQFFGGEPLIHKQLILNFLSRNKSYLEQHAHGATNQLVSMITNGLLLTPEFISEYFSYSFTWMMISLDTLDSSLDHRELKPGDIQSIINSIKQIPQAALDRVVMRCTISRETAPGMKEYIDTMVGLGLKNIIIHPLVLDSTHGFISWPQDEWDRLHSDLVYAVETYDDLKISFSEGVGKKKENNCMIGSDMIAIDASGDFSGCYFFTNQKANGTGPMILGNLFTEEIYVDRYKEFQTAFNQMFEEEEQCKTCDYKDRCYQCPAGNLDTGSKMFRPDSMCQNIVKLYVDLQDDIIKKQYKKKFQKVVERIQNSDEHTVFNSTLINLMYLMFSGKHVAPDEHGRNTELTAEQICGAWKQLLESKQAINTDVFSEFNKEIPCTCDVTPLNIKEFYEFMLRGCNLPVTKSRQVTTLEFTARVGYLVLLELLVYNVRVQNIHSSFTEDLISL